MTPVVTRIQLVVFALVTVLAVGYGTVNFFGLSSVFSPPYEVRAQFASSGGIYQRADVDLLGTRVGTVRRIVPGPGTGTTVVMAIDRGVKIPKDVAAAIGNKSAIGEQYVALTPKTAGSPYLVAGDVISRDRTSSPVDVAVLLKDLDGLAGSIPVDDLRTVLKETSTALAGIGGTLGHLIDNTDRLTQASLAGADDLTALIEDASTVLDTQVEKGPETTAYLHEIAGLTSELRRIDGSFDELFANGIRAGVEVSNLLADNQAALPVLLNNLVSLTTVVRDRLPALRKTLVLFPHALEIGGTGVRRCGEYNAKTGKPIEATCRYDAQGRPIYSGYLALALPQLPGTPPYFPCTKGYEDTVKHQPNGVPLKGGPVQEKDSPPNMKAGCTAAPDDPNTPNVRGAQNVIGTSAGAGRAAPTLGLLDPASGTVVSPAGSYRVTGTSGDRPPTGSAGLAWLLNGPLS